MLVFQDVFFSFLEFFLEGEQFFKKRKEDNCVSKAVKNKKIPRSRLMSPSS